MPKLNEPDILSRMPTAKDWERLGDMLVRSWQFPSSRRALEFVNQVAGLADRLDHYPDIILSYRTVRLELSTHADGGLTDDDFAMAAEVNALPIDR
jgi:4a-hydroxytetrahydrobiopterin dehydratase